MSTTRASLHHIIFFNYVIHFTIEVLFEMISHNTQFETIAMNVGLNSKSYLLLMILKYYS